MGQILFCQAKKPLNKGFFLCSLMPLQGIGKPEPLKYHYSGAWSRRITEEHRLIYMIEDGEIYFLSFRDHYK